ncbi:hypothetical protein [endosymbiont GvMRE of Glomus versiforme]|uniref:hypothetical protein n=1 Tax=endosymbiont GvMRE of Glomus versiforme TaxID=2039283 RepID=UPI0011C3EEF6|nr:hypothetical protein [endosymbiont GvMRE of Glomus versiforme]
MTFNWFVPKRKKEAFQKQCVANFSHASRFCFSTYLYVNNWHNRWSSRWVYPTIIFTAVDTAFLAAGIVGDFFPAQEEEEAAILKKRRINFSVWRLLYQV